MNYSAINLTSIAKIDMIHKKVSLVTSNIFNIPCSNEIELLCVKISFGKSSVFIINLYLPPNSNDKVYTTVTDGTQFPHRCEVLWKKRSFILKE